MQPLPISTFLDLGAQRLHFAPGEAQGFGEGLTFLQRLGADLPVWLLRIETGVPVRVVRLNPVSPAEICADTLLPGVTAFAAAFELDGAARLVVVSPTPLRRPAQGGSDYPQVFGSPKPLRPGETPPPDEFWKRRRPPAPAPLSAQSAPAPSSTQGFFGAGDPPGRRTKRARKLARQGR